MKWFLSALALFALVPSSSQAAGACELTGTFIGYQHAGVIAELQFVTPVFDDAETSCADPTVVMPSPMMEQWVVGTPHFRLGGRYELTLREGGTLGSHLIESTEPRPESNLASGQRIPWAPAPILKPGNDQPPCTVGAWRPNGPPVPLEIHSAGSEDIGGGADLDAIRAAAAEWASPASASAAFEITLYDDWIDRAADGRTTFAFVDSGTEIFDSLGPENLGFTCVVCDEDGYIIEADVRLNGLDRTWTTECDGVEFDVFGAALHELGHVLGMIHTGEPDSAMFPVTSARRLLDTRTLSRGDVLALAALYPCDDGDCGGPSEAQESCPPGAALCASCAADSECGANSDRCITDRVTGESFCARECSSSFPCPRGFECVSIGDGSQCVPLEGVCPQPETFVGCECEDDTGCGEEDDVCLEGRCASACGAGLGCPADSSCTAVLGADGLPAGWLCLAEPDLDPCAPEPLEPNCERCGTSDGAGLWFGFVIAGITLARRRVLVAIRCR